jgi:hypothetical protein
MACTIPSNDVVLQTGLEIMGEGGIGAMQDMQWKRLACHPDRLLPPRASAWPLACHPPGTDMPKMEGNAVGPGASCLSFHREPIRHLLCLVLVKRRSAWTRRHLDRRAHELYHRSRFMHDLRNQVWHHKIRNTCTASLFHVPRIVLLADGRLTKTCGQSCSNARTPQTKEESADFPLPKKI